MRRIGATALLLMFTVAAGGCGDSDGDKTSARSTATRTEPAAVDSAQVPASLGRLESGAEDVIDEVRAGDRAAAVKTARATQREAAGRAATDLRKAGVPLSEISELQARAVLLATLAPRAEPVRVSLAANSVSALMPEFYARYDDPVPSAVLELDYLDREAQLRSQAGDRRSTRAAVTGLAGTWAKLRRDVIAAGGARVAARFGRHVDAMRRLARGAAAGRALQSEAGTGLELVDELERQFRRSDRD